MTALVVSAAVWWFITYRGATGIASTFAALAGAGDDLLDASAYASPGTATVLGQPAAIIYAETRMKYASGTGSTTLFLARALEGFQSLGTLNDSSLVGILVHHGSGAVGPTIELEQATRGDSGTRVAFLTFPGRARAIPVLDEGRR
jgi:hypothetical protein